MRVLQVTTSDQRRGAEVFAHDLARALEHLGHEVTTTALEHSEDPAPLPAVVLGPGRSHPRTASALLGAIRAHDVAIAHGGPSLIPVSVVSSIAGRPFIYRNIGDPSYWGDVRLADIRVGAPLRRAARVVALYEGAREQLIGRYRLPPDRVTVASNAVDLAAFPRRDDATRQAARSELGVGDRPVVAYLGALSSEKRPELAVAVAASVPDVHLLVAGTGPMRDAVEASAEREAPGRVRFLGSWDRPARLLEAADVLILPSRTEGVPGSLLEAIAVGTPVVATAVGGVGEVLRDLGGGIAVPDGEDLLDRLVLSARTILRRPGSFHVDRTELAADHGIDSIAARYDAALRWAVDPRL